MQPPPSPAGTSVTPLSSVAPPSSLVPPSLASPSLAAPPSGVPLLEAAGAELPAASAPAVPAFIVAARKKSQARFFLVSEGRSMVYVGNRRTPFAGTRQKQERITGFS